MPKALQHDFAIAGDGIAGRAMALALGRLGHKVTVIAPKAEISAKGGVQLAPNSWSALDDLGVSDAVMKGAITLNMMRMVSLTTGHNLFQLGLNTSKNRTPYTSMTRAHLIDALGKAAKATKNVKWHDASITMVKTEAETAHFSTDDSKNHHAQWLIGTDSVSGICRQYVEARDETAIAPDVIARRVAFRMTVKAGGLPPRFHANATTVWLGDGGHLVYYPLSDGTVNIVAVISHSPSAKNRIAAMLSSQPQLKAIIPHLDDAIQTPLFDYAMLDSYQRGRIVLAGDAAHPMPPHLAQGAGQSLVDAASLMKALKGYDGISLAPLFTSWTAARVRACRDIKITADRAGAVFAMSGPMAKLRNLGLASVASPIVERQLDQLWRS